MSYAEIICNESLTVILRPNTEVLKNFRPDFLRNPATGRRLEMDFYLPRAKVALEIQGPHHYEDDKQKIRDRVKRELLAQAAVTLIELTIFQISPSRLHTKLSRTRVSGDLVKFDRKLPEWDRLQKKYQAYRVQIQASYTTNYFRAPKP